jgi:hypothetical protein
LLNVITRAQHAHARASGRVRARTYIDSRTDDPSGTRIVSISLDEDRGCRCARCAEGVSANHHSSMAFSLRAFDDALVKNPRGHLFERGQRTG